MTNSTTFASGVQHANIPSANPKEALLNSSVVTAADLARRYGLKSQKVKGKLEYHGRNPWESGATENGFWLREDGTAYDRTNGGRNYSSREVAQLSGLEPTDYEPCRNYLLRNANDLNTSPTSSPAPKVALTPQERGLRPETVSLFNITSSAQGWRYPTFQADGTLARVRFKAARYFKGKKYRWEGTAPEPPGYGLNLLAGAKEVWIVGGEPDVWAASQAGLKAVATFGEGQGYEKLMPALQEAGVECVFVALDNDRAGHEGTVKALETARKVGIEAEARVLSGPLGFDVCDLYRETGFEDGTFRAEMRRLPQADAATLEVWSHKERSQNKAKTTGAPAPRIVTAEELLKMEIEPIRWVVEGVLGEGLTVCAGSPKLGKSYFLLNIGLAVAFGGVALGSLPVEAGDVLILALEDTLRRVQSRLKQMLGGEAPPPRLHFACQWPRLDQGGKAELEAWLQAHPEARLVVIDTFKVNRPERGNGRDLYGEDYEHARLYKAIADKYGVAIVLIHHTTKLTSDDPLKTVSGTMGLTGAADTILVLTRDRNSPNASAFVTGRDVEERKLKLRFDSVLGAWAYDGDEDTAPTEAELDGKERQALELLEARFPDGATAAQWEKACLEVHSQSRATFYRARVGLEKQERLTKSVEGRGALYRPRFPLIPSQRPFETDEAEEENGLEETQADALTLFQGFESESAAFEEGFALCYGKD